MKWFSEENERSTWFEIYIFWPLAFLGFGLVVFFLMFMPE